MAGFKRCLGVDLGSSSIKVVELVLAKDKRGLIVQKACQAPLELPPGAPETERSQIVAKTLRELLKSNRIQTKRAVFNLPGQTIFVRRIRLPITSEERLERIVRFEARQQIPFPPDQTILQWETFDVPGGEEMDVLLAAIRKDIITSYMGIISRCGLKPIQIGVSFFSLFNYYVFANRGIPEPEGAAKKKAVKKTKKKKRFSLSLRKKKKTADEEADELEAEEPEDEVFEVAPAFSDELEEIKAYINIGASTFDLAIHRQTSRDLMGFQRSVPYAGNEITRAIQQGLSLPDREAAEAIKHERVQAIIPGFTDEDSEGYDLQACEAAGKALDRVVSEIRRSLDFYISQPDGMAVDAIEISGGQAALDNLPLFLEEKLGVPVEFTDSPPLGDHLRFPNDEPPEDMHRYPIAIGLALGGMGFAEIGINFLPHGQQVQLAFRKKYALVAAMLGLIAAMLVLNLDIGAGHTAVLERESQALRVKVKKDQQLKLDIEKFMAERQIVADHIEILGHDAVPRRPEYWFDVVLAAMYNAKPPAIVFSGINLDGGKGKMWIQGIARSQKASADFTSNLNNRGGIYPACGKLIAEAKMKDAVDVELLVVGKVTKFLIEVDLKDQITRFQRPEEIAPPDPNDPSEGNYNEVQAPKTQGRPTRFRGSGAQPVNSSNRSPRSRPGGRLPAIEASPDS